MAKSISCKECGGENTMTRHKWSTGNGKVLVGLIVIVIGIALAFMWPVVGWILGFLLVLWGLSMGGTRHKGWKCSNCGYFFETK